MTMPEVKVGDVIEFYDNEVLSPTYDQRVTGTVTKITPIPEKFRSGDGDKEVSVERPNGYHTYVEWFEGDGWSNIG